MTENNEDNFEIFNPETGKMNFDAVNKLYKDDPEKLERMQLEAVRKLIESAPEIYQRRLNGLQFQIDAHRRLSKNPAQSFIKLSSLFWTGGLFRLNDALHARLDQPEESSANNIIEMNRDHSTDDPSL